MGLWTAVVSDGEQYVVCVVDWVLAIVIVGGAVVTVVGGSTEKLCSPVVVQGGGVGGRGGGGGGRAGNPSLRNLTIRFLFSSTVPAGSRWNFINSASKSSFRNW